ncbi:hypothetical protein [Neosynechococcus sphagnicola]|uniref:hypothetical protein n=1 Tax=Neosynechococcus sphagnicola TaxID=1501145 RepID=UPI001EF9FC9A|nr:hypothetical protein [Neosynechococcus sphagnicola]
MAAILGNGLPVHTCPDCDGAWIASPAYAAWQTQQVLSDLSSPSDWFVKMRTVEFTQPPLDTKAALCPECGRFLARVKIPGKSAFYIERCSTCGGNLVRSRRVGGAGTPRAQYDDSPIVYQ